MFPKETLGLLRSLNSENRLTTTDTKWKHELGDLIREYLSAWVLNEEWVCDPVQRLTTGLVTLNRLLRYKTSSLWLLFSLDWSRI